jgi:hypothetical protein
MKLIAATFMGLVHVDAVVIRTPAVYTVYLTHQRSDPLPVTVVLPALDHDVVTFAFPRMVRGIAGAVARGRMVHDLSACDAHGVTIAVRKVDVIRCVIDEGRSLRHPLHGG